MIPLGTVGTETMTVTEDRLAISMASGALPVLGTPAMIFLVEKTAAESVQKHLPKGKSTVGTHLDIRHSAPSVLGSEITCSSELVAIDRSRLTFDIDVRDEFGEIGSGTHERFIVDNDAFVEKARKRTEAVE